MVFGPRKAVAKALIWANIAWLALRVYRSPTRAADVLRRMVRQRALTQRWTTAKYAYVRGRYFWNLYAPGWPSRAFDGYVRRELDRVEPHRSRPPALQTAIVAITNKCAFRCEHCCEWPALNRGETLSRDDLAAIVGRLRAFGVAQLFFSGGEPLRRLDDLVALAREASPDTDVWILTSGHQLTREKARVLREAGLTGVALSVDHWDPAEHDRFRGRGDAFEWVERAAEHTRAAGLVLALSLCPTRSFTTRANLDRYAELAGRLGASFVQILEPKAVGHYAGHDVALDDEQQRMLEEFCDRLGTDAPSRRLPAVSYADYAKRTIGCLGAGDRYVYVDTEGELHPCPFCREPAGRVLSGDLPASLGALRARGCPSHA